MSDEFAALTAARTDGELEAARHRMLEAYKARLLVVYRRRRRELHRAVKGEETQMPEEPEPPEPDEMVPMQEAPP
jgi:hypothetical protein